MHGGTPLTILSITTSDCRDGKFNSGENQLFRHNKKIVQNILQSLKGVVSLYLILFYLFAFLKVFYITKPLTINVIVLFVL